MAGGTAPLLARVTTMHVSAAPEATAADDIKLRREIIDLSPARPTDPLPHLSGVLRALSWPTDAVRTKNSIWRRRGHQTA
jgi:hypothetical protein